MAKENAEKVLYLKRLSFFSINISTLHNVYIYMDSLNLGNCFLINQTWKRVPSSETPLLWQIDGKLKFRSFHWNAAKVTSSKHHQGRCFCLAMPSTVYRKKYHDIRKFAKWSEHIRTIWYGNLAFVEEVKFCFREIAKSEGTPKHSGSWNQLITAVPKSHLHTMQANSIC